MKRAMMKAVLGFGVSFCAAVATASCYNLVSSDCGENQLYPCATYCVKTETECESSNLTTRQSVRSYNDCTTYLGSSWKNCDDRETKTTCTEGYECLALSDQECEGSPGTYQCVAGGDVIVQTVYWSTIVAISCGD